MHMNHIYIVINDVLYLLDLDKVDYICYGMTLILGSFSRNDSNIGSFLEINCKHAYFMINLHEV